MAYTKIAVDAMGGDHAPDVVIEGSVSAVKENKEIKVFLVGKEELINKGLSGYTYNKEQIEVVNANDVIDMHDSPVMAVRRKKESSIVVGMNMVKAGEADAFVSAGSTGAVIAGGTIIVGRIKGIKRPALATFLPTEKGFSLLMDIGASSEGKPEFMRQYAHMGKIYYESFMGGNNARVGLVNIGEEDTKGSQLYKDAYQLLKADEHINFVGNAEARYITSGNFDVIVCDGFTGNIILKFAEGLSASLLTMIKDAIKSSPISSLGGLLIKKSLKGMMKKMDYTEIGGAPLLGLNGLVVKAHGSSDAHAIKNSILQCFKFYAENVNDKIKQELVNE